MSEGGVSGAAERRWQDALLAVALLAVDPGLGLALRGLPGPLRDRLLGVLRDWLPEAAPLRRVPLHIGDDRLLGGLDLAASLRAGRAVAARGLLAEADGGVVVLAMGERVSVGVAARLAAVLDGGVVVAEREGMTQRSRAGIGVLALDESEGDEAMAACLADRLGMRVDLAGIGLREATAASFEARDVAAARERLARVTAPDAMLVALCGTAAGLGVDSARAALLALRAARAAAALGGRAVAQEADALDAVRLVLAPRATRLPEMTQEQASEPAADQAPPDLGETPPAEQSSEAPESEGAGERPLEEMMIAAARSAMPAGLLARLLMGGARRQASSTSGAGVPQAAARRGRPIGVRAGGLRGGARINLVATLRAAAPWQRARRRDMAGAARVRVLPDDIRITRFAQRTETTTIFVVDASGSTALNRLGEAKGAVELVLAECYVRRDRVALIGFRGAAAELLLPPTGSLARARRSLAALPGGGGTPLAAGLEAGFVLADGLRRRGQTPILLLLSDGRANIGRDGKPGRERAEADALAAAKLLRAAGIACLMVDTSPRAAPQARRLAEAMGARYLPLPYADGAAMARAVQQGGGAHVG